jgi:hypothetical protein
MPLTNLDSLMHRRSSRHSTNTMLLLHTTNVRSLKALDIPKTSLKQRTNQTSEEGNKRKRLKRALQATLVDAGRGVRRTSAIVLVVLRRENKRREPEVRQNPRQGGEVAFVLLNRGQSERGEVEDRVDGSL